MHTMRPPQKGDFEHIIFIGESGTRRPRRPFREGHRIRSLSHAR